MKILGHIHTFNDEEVIDRSLGALLDQSRPLDGILIVDNASIDGTLARPFPDSVTLIRHPENRGTSGAVLTGFQYAMERGYDWIWVFDADSMPCKTALRKLLELYDEFPREAQDQIWRLSSLPMELPNSAVTTRASWRLLTSTGSLEPQPRHGVVFTRRGYTAVQPRPRDVSYEFHSGIWTGSLFKLEAIRKIGLPWADYVLDIHEFAYGYQAMQRGYRAFMHVSSIVNHNITGEASIRFTRYALGRLSFQLIELPPIRCYYVVRNTLYFWLYEYHVRNAYTIVPRLYKILLLTANFLLRPIGHRAELMACLRGIRDGLLKRMERRY